MAKASPAKPRVDADFPLKWHKASGQWFKWHKGKFHYFGSNADEALKRYLKEKDYIFAGVPVPTTEAITVRQLCNAFLASKDARQATGQITGRTFAQLTTTCKKLAAHFGDRAVHTLSPGDFDKFRAFIATRSPVVLKNQMIRTRSVFKFGVENRLLERPVDFGSAFTLPDKSELRKHRAKHQKPTFTKAEIHTFLDGRPDPEPSENPTEKVESLAGADAELKAWILLGLNCGFYAIDISGLLHRHIEGEFIEFPREKTGVFRRCWLWPETREAIAAVATDPKEFENVFIARNGKPLMNLTKEDQRIDAVANKFSVLKRRMKYKRAAAGFKNFRHTFRTVADAAGDQPATMLIMGHADSGISDVYRHGIADSRLIAVAQFVRSWLFTE